MKNKSFVLNQDLFNSLYLSEVFAKVFGECVDISSSVSRMCSTLSPMSAERMLTSSHSLHHILNLETIETMSNESIDVMVDGLG